MASVSRCVASLNSIVARTLGAAACLALVACGVDAPKSVTAPSAPAPVPAPSPSPAPAPSPSPARPPIPLPPGAPPSATRLTFVSDPGEFVGWGLSRTYYLGDGTWSATFDNYDRGHVSIRVSHF